jgi:hypothetical protein
MVQATGVGCNDGAGYRLSRKNERLEVGETGALITRLRWVKVEDDCSNVCRVQLNPLRD